MRTIVIGDAHGYPWIIENALEHAGFDPATDRFVFTGDFLDRGPDPQACLDLDRAVRRPRSSSATTSSPCCSKTPSLRSTRPARCSNPTCAARVLDAPPDEAWRCAIAVDGVLVTHAGVPAALSRAPSTRSAAATSSAFADGSTRRSTRVLRSSISRWAVEWEGLLGLDGPFWFRPRGLARRRASCRRGPGRRATRRLAATKAGCSPRRPLPDRPRRLRRAEQPTASATR